MVCAMILVPALFVVPLDYHDDEDAPRKVGAGEGHSALPVHSLLKESDFIRFTG